MKNYSKIRNKANLTAEEVDDEITKTLQIGRLAECGILVLEPYIKKVSENPKLTKLKIGQPYTQHIAQVKRLYNFLNDEKDLNEKGYLSNDSVSFISLIKKNKDKIGLTLDQILKDEEIFDAIIRNENPQKLNEKAKIAKNNLRKLYEYMNTSGLTAIYDKNKQ